MNRRVAHVNVATLKYAADDERMQPFFAAVPAMNALAEASPGFVWRLTDADEEARAPALFGEPNMIIALSVWQSIDALRDFVYRSEHGDYLRQRTSYFRPRATANKALWWIEPGTLPTILEAKHRLDWLTLHGPGDVAFGFNTKDAKEAS